MDYLENRIKQQNCQVIYSIEILIIKLSFVMNIATNIVTNANKH